MHLRKCEFLPFTPRLPANVHLAERRGSKHDEEKYTAEEEEGGARTQTQREAKRRETKGKEEERNALESRVQEASTSSGVQRSLYGQAIFTTKPPGRAEVTREVTRYFRHVIPTRRRYSHSPPGKKERLANGAILRG